MLDALDQEIIKRLQEDLPLTKEPYKKLAEELNIEEDQLLERLSYFREKGLLKRIGAVLYHREAGFQANALVVWKVPSVEVDRVGAYMASLPEISHCYERVTCENWDYNLFTMLHGKTKLQCQETIINIASKLHLYDYKILYSMRELKKSSMKYFC